MVESTYYVKNRHYDVWMWISQSNTDVFMERGVTFCKCHFLVLYVHLN